MIYELSNFRGYSNVGDLIMATDLMLVTESLF